ncbi:MAG TPA: hypothetical protein P5081_00275 [Phycisphaerae bacterium]|nr:hypothetical protein [Phycisphaerae bacterium]HRW51288.1 hypothetical protein [Phycisphaerae bacterium]
MQRRGTGVTRALRISIDDAGPDIVNPEEQRLSSVRVVVPDACPRCGYRLEGLPTKHMCPECGCAYEPDMLVFGRPVKATFGPYLTIGLVGLAISGLIVLNVMIGVGEVVSVLAPISAVLAVQIVFLAPWKKRWAIVHSDGVLWRESFYGDRYIAWKDVAAVKSGDMPPYLIIRPVKGRSLQRLCEIITTSRRELSCAAIVQELSGRWVSALAAAGVASDVDAMTRDSAAAFRRERGLKQGAACPVCRGILGAGRDGVSACHNCGGIFNDDAIVVPYVKRPIAPWHWFSLLVAGMVFWAGFVSTKETNSLGYSIRVGTVLVAIFVAAIAWNYFRYRRPRLFVIDNQSIAWESVNGGMRQLAWGGVGSVLCASDRRAICLRMSDGHIEPVPEYYLQDRSDVGDLARYIRAMCDEERNSAPVASH